MLFRSRTRGIDGALQAFGVDALLMPANVASGPAALAGYPIVSGKPMHSHLRLRFLR